MNCKHCGYPINRGQKVCPSCGKTVRRRRGGLVFLLVLLLLAAAVFGALHYRDVGNYFVRRQMDDGEYYRHVELQNYEDLSELAEKLLAKNPLLSLKHDRFDLGFRLGDTAQELLAALNSSKIPLDWIHALAARVEINRQDGRSSAQLALRLNDVDILSLLAATDPESGMASLSVPELSETPVLGTMESLGLGDGSLDLEGLLAHLPSAEKRRAVVSRYLSLALDQIGTLESGTAVLKADTLSRECTLFTVRLTDTELNALEKKLCETLRTDEEALGLLEELLRPIAKDPDALREDVLQRLDKLIAGLDKFKSKGANYVIRTYVDAAGRIAGREILVDRKGGELVLSRALLVKNGRLGLELRLEQDGKTSSFVGGGRLQGLGLTGEFKALSNGTEMLTLDADAALKGVIKGVCTLTLRPERAMLRAMKLDETAESLAKDLRLRLRYDNTEDPAELSLVLLHDEDAIVTTGLEHTPLPAEAIELPTHGLSLAEWTKSIKLPNLFGNGSFGTVFDRLSQAGMPSELIVGAKLLLPQLIK